MKGQDQLPAITCGHRRTVRIDDPLVVLTLACERASLHGGIHEVTIRPGYVTRWHDDGRYAQPMGTPEVAR